MKKLAEFSKYPPSEVSTLQRKRWLQHFGGLKINIFIRDVLYNFSFVSVAYIITFSVTVGFIFPLQQLLLSNVPAYIGLFFLPHGVKILTLYFYGWRGMFYLLPASVLMIILTENQTGWSLLSPIVSLTCCYLGVQFVRILFSDTISVSFVIKDWQLLFWGGVMGSIFNGFGLTFLNQTYKSTVDNSAFLLEVIGFAVGDVLGLIFCLLSIVYLFRMIRFIKIIPDKKEYSSMVQIVYTGNSGIAMDGAAISEEDSSASL